ncbi:MAG: heme oxygenase [Oscillatoriales cyanobacterium]|jgi:heme oxygenase (biliverdin-producing, ferredoxin)|nr:MAG: heme oxygenase [Oscillatoriales cyanobacterium]
MTQLATRLREGTGKSHTIAENTAYMKCFLKGIMAREPFRKLMANLYLVYGTLEDQIRQHLDCPAVKGLYFPEIERQANLAKDLEFYYGDQWQTEIEPTEAGQQYVARIQAAADIDPALLVAHAYVRYMGDLSGGQALKMITRKALNLPPDRGTGLHEFASLPTPEAQRDFKMSYRDALNALPVTEEQITAIVEEANLAFALNRDVMHSLEEDVKAAVGWPVFEAIVHGKDRQGSTEVVAHH